MLKPFDFIVGLLSRIAHQDPGMGIADRVIDPGERYGHSVEDMIRIVQNADDGDLEKIRRSLEDEKDS